MVVRRLLPSDSLEHLTDLLHRAYKRSLDAGLNFVATTQTVEVTYDRCWRGTCFVAEIEGRVVGTISVYEASPEDLTEAEYYRQPGIRYFGQFAVEPEFQGQGIGDALLDAAETHAKKSGGHELALDTAEPSTGLLHYYTQRGYELVGSVKWGSASYRSVIMSKKL